MKLDKALLKLGMKKVALEKKLFPPPPTAQELQDQIELLQTDWDWIIWFDGGNYRHFKELYPEYLEGELIPTYNGGHGYTGDWSMAHLRRKYPDKGLFSPVPLHTLANASYDERRWFDVTPEADAYHGPSVNERLAALGYREKTNEMEQYEAHALNVNRVIRKHLSEVSGGIIRYVKPHPPFDGLREFTQGIGKRERTKFRLWTRQLSQAELEQAYIDTYRTAFEGAVDIIPELDGKIVITADHGEALYESCCRQLFHTRNHEECECFTRVPWFEVEGVK